MRIANNQLDFNKEYHFDFDGGNMSTDGGMILFRGFLEHLGFPTLAESAMDSGPGASGTRKYTDSALLGQIVLQTVAGYTTDVSANHLRHDALLPLLNDGPLASQSTLSRWRHRSDESMQEGLRELLQCLRQNVFQIRTPEEIIIDLDTTLIKTSGKNQEGAKYNVHYSDTGYHPFVAFDGITGDMLKAELRDGTKYCSNGAGIFLDELLRDLAQDAPEAGLTFRGDSGFAAPEVYESLEALNCGYAIKLKLNGRLTANPAFRAAQIRVIGDLDVRNEVEEYGEFQHEAASWGRRRRVVFRAKRAKGTMFCEGQFIVTSLPGTPEEIFDFYRARGNAENFIKEFKNDFAQSLPHESMETNAVRFQIQALCYNLFNWFRRLCLTGRLGKSTASTIRLQLLRVAVRVTRSGRYTRLHFSSSWPYRRSFLRAAETVKQLHQF